MSKTCSFLFLSTFAFGALALGCSKSSDSGPGAAAAPAEKPAEAKKPTPAEYEACKSACRAKFPAKSQSMDSLQCSAGCKLPY